MTEKNPLGLKKIHRVVFSIVKPLRFNTQCRMHYFFRSLCFLLCSTGFVLAISAQSGEQLEWFKRLMNPPISTPEIRQKTFEEAWENIKNNHYDSKFNGVDWKKIKKTYATKVVQTQNDEQLIDLLNEMVGELRVSHNSVMSPKFILQGETAKTADIGIKIKFIEGKTLVTKVRPNSSSQIAGLRQGYAIQEIDGVSTERIVQETAKKNKIPYLKTAEIDSVLNKILNGDEKTKVEIVFADEKDINHKVEIERQKKDGELIKVFGITPIFSKITVELLDNNIGYLAFNTFLEKKEKLLEAVNSLKDSSAIIIDLRENGGGLTDTMLAFVSVFFEKPTGFAKTLRRNGIVERSDDKTGQVNESFTGKLVVLINSQTASASETISAGLQEIGRGVIIGERSGGNLLRSTPRILPNSSIQLVTQEAPLTPKGLIIEGKGVIPNIEVRLTRENLLKGGDPQLDAAIKFLKES